MDRILATNPLAYVFTRNGSANSQLVAELPASKRAFSITSEALSVLHYASTPREHCSILRFEKENLQLNAAAALALLDQLTEAELLVPARDLKDSALCERKHTWGRHSWQSAFYYYLWVRDYPFLDYSKHNARQTDADLMTQYAGEEPHPDVFKDYPDSRNLMLPHAHDDGSWLSLTACMNPQSLSSARAPSRDSLGQLLGVVFGQTGQIRRKSFPPLLLKTSPSGGARHPIEAYVAILDLPGVAKGLYHYSVRNHSLELLQAGDFRDQMTDIVYSLHSIESTSAIVFFTSIWKRAAWRYRDPRAYRPVLHDLGHLVESFALAARGLTLRHQLHHGFNDSAAEQLFGLDGFSESVLYYGALLE